MGMNPDLNPIAMVEEEVARTIEDLDLHSYYQLLEVDQDAANDIIVANHWVLTREYRQIHEHPSCSAELRENLTQILERLDEALLVLGDRRLRSSYDERLEMGETRVQIKQTSTGTFSLDDFERETADLPPGPVMPRQPVPAPRKPLPKQAPAPKPRPPAWQPVPQDTTGLDALPNAPDFQDLDLELSVSSSSIEPPPPEEQPGVPFGPDVDVPQPEESFTQEVEASAERSSQILRRFMMAVNSKNGDGKGGASEQLKMVGEDTDDEVTVDETSSDAYLADETSSDGTSLDVTSSDETSSDGTSSDGTSSDGTSSDGTTLDGTSSDGTTSDGTSSDGTSSDEMTSDEMTSDAYLEDGDTVRTAELPQMTREEEG
jgi:hypothetical protein